VRVADFVGMRVRVSLDDVSVSRLSTQRGEWV